MSETFYTSTDATEITGCTRRQLQYWREQGFIVPTVNATGKGRNVYYSESDLLKLMAIKRFLDRGLSFDVANEALQILIIDEPEMFLNPRALEKLRRLVFFSSEEEIEKWDFDQEEILKRLNQSSNILAIPFWEESLRQELKKNLEEFHNKKSLEEGY